MVPHVLHRKNEDFQFKEKHKKGLLISKTAEEKLIGENERNSAIKAAAIATINMPAPSVIGDILNK